MTLHDARTPSPSPLDKWWGVSVVERLILQRAFRNAVPATSERGVLEQQSSVHHLTNADIGSARNARQARP